MLGRKLSILLVLILSAAPLQSQMATVTIQPEGPIVIPPGSFLGFSSTIQNNLTEDLTGDYWLVVKLNTGQEILIPQEYLLLDNPLSGTIPPGVYEIPWNELYYLETAPSGTFELIARVGVYPNTIVDEDSFSFTFF